MAKAPKKTKSSPTDRPEVKVAHTFTVQVHMDARGGITPFIVPGVVTSNTVGDMFVLFGPLGQGYRVLAEFPIDGMLGAVWVDDFPPTVH